MRRLKQERLRRHAMSQPEIFIIESLDFKDERAERFEGRIISQILALSGKRCEYCYIRTKRELKALLERFEASHYRYLHLSCHGSTDSMFTTLDSIKFSEFGLLVKPYLRKRRLFVSACSAPTRPLPMPSCPLPVAIRFWDPIRTSTSAMRLCCGRRFIT